MNGAGLYTNTKYVESGELKCHTKVKTLITHMFSRYCGYLFNLNFFSLHNSSHSYFINFAVLYHLHQSRWIVPWTASRNVWEFCFKTICSCFKNKMLFVRNIEKMWINFLIALPPELIFYFWKSIFPFPGVFTAVNFAYLRFVTVSVNL